MRHPQTTQECKKYLNSPNDCGELGGDGQNIAWMRKFPKIDAKSPTAFNESIDEWYDECDGYDQAGWNMTDPNLNPKFIGPGGNKETGHYTQMMWKNANKIGCGFSQCGNQVLVTCNYGTDNPKEGRRQS